MNPNPPPETAWHPLADGCPPDWARGWGQDRYGVWIDLILDDSVRQRLRWIPAGGFRMGSPDREQGRYKSEGPQHEVIISRGYWLFDTPCTQALWEAVMGENHSRFKSPDRPVENVDWNQVQRFIERMNSRVPGLDLVLPSEAQWEYACRAGTQTATYAGDLLIRGELNGPVLNPIAWYGGNSGVEFELNEGENSSNWPNKQFPHKKAGTHPVGLKDPNFWGLYDMLGNVFEWCQDGLRDYGEALATDPVGSLAVGAERVVRGGSWVNDARYERAAFRGQFHPDKRGDLLGFRCARVRW